MPQKGSSWSKGQKTVERFQLSSMFPSLLVSRADLTREGYFLTAFYWRSVVSVPQEVPLSPSWRRGERTALPLPQSPVPSRAPPKAVEWGGSGAIAGGAFSVQDFTLWMVAPQNCRATHCLQITRHYSESKSKQQPWPVTTARSSQVQFKNMVPKYSYFTQQLSFYKQNTSY